MVRPAPRAYLLLPSTLQRQRLGVGPLLPASSDDDDVRVQARETDDIDGAATAVVHASPRAYLMAPPTLPRLGIATLLPTRSDHHVRIRASEANDIDVAAAAAMVRSSPRGYLLSPPTLLQGLITAPLLSAGEANRVAGGAMLSLDVGEMLCLHRGVLILANPSATGAKVGDFPLAVGRRDAHEPERGACAFLVVAVAGVDSTHTALNLTGGYGGAMLCVDRAALKLDGNYGGPMLCLEDAALNLTGAAMLCVDRAPLNLDGNYGGRMLCLEDATLNLTGGAMLCVDRAALNLDGNYGGAMLCLDDAALGPRRAAFLGPPLAERPMAAAGAILCTSPFRAPLLHHGKVGSKEAVAVAGAAPLLGVTGRRGYSTEACGNGEPEGEDAGKKSEGNVHQSSTPRVKSFQERQVIAKLSKLQLHVRGIKKIVFHHAQFSLSHSRAMELKGQKLENQVSMLPVWFFGWLLVSIAVACYIVAKVLTPHVAEVASNEFIKLAHELKDMANEVDEEKIMKMAKELTKVITHEIIDCIGGRVKTSILESLKFWKW